MFMMYFASHLVNRTTLIFAKKNVFLGTKFSILPKKKKKTLFFQREQYLLINAKKTIK